MGKDVRPVEVTVLASALLELLELAERVLSANEFLDEMREQVKLASAGGEKVRISIRVLSANE